MSTLPAQHHVEESLGDQGRVVTWRGSGDDWSLKAALSALLEPVARAPKSATHAAR